MDILLALWGLAMKVPDWISHLRSQRKEQAEQALAARVLEYFERSQTMLIGRFCPAIDDILQGLGAQNRDEVRGALGELVRDRVLEYDVGRYYLASRSHDHYGC